MTKQNAKAGSAKLQCPPVIGIDRGEIQKVTKTNSVVFKLYTTPSDTDSPQYEMTVPIFKTGTPERWLETRKSIDKVFLGLNLTSGPYQYQQVRRILQGDALATFDKAATKHGNETTNNLKLCLDEVTKHVFPNCALQKQKRYMRRALRKPRDMSIKEYDARLEELNNMLKWFCDEVDNTRLCPRIGQKIDTDEMKDILYFSIPNKWHKQAIVQGFNTLDKDRDEIVAFCERMEECEELEGDTKTKTVKNPNGQSRHNGKRKANSSSVGKFCMLHGKDKGHDTDECKVLMAQSKRMRGMYESRSETDRAKIRRESRYASKDNGGYKNTFSSKAEFHAIINQQVERALKQRVTGFGKRKREKKDLNMAERPCDVSEQGDNDVSDNDMDQFNFEDLKIDMSDDESNLDDLSY